MNEHDWTCCFLRASTTAPLKETSAKQAGIEFCFMRKKGDLVLNPFQAGDSGAEVRVEAAHYSQIQVAYTFFYEECIEMMGSSGKAVCRPVVKVAGMKWRNHFTLVWFSCMLRSVAETSERPAATAEIPKQVRQQLILQQSQAVTMPLFRCSRGIWVTCKRPSLYVSRRVYQ